MISWNQFVIARSVTLYCVIHLHPSYHVSCVYNMCVHCHQLVLRFSLECYCMRWLLVRTNRCITVVKYEPKNVEAVECLLKGNYALLYCVKHAPILGMNPAWRASRI